MNKCKEINFKITRWVFTKVFDNTILTIILVTVASSLVTTYHQRIVESPGLLVTIAILCLVAVGAYKLLSKEKVMKKVKFNKENLVSEWDNNEFRNNIPATAYITNEKALHIQFMDIPFTLNFNLPEAYALEFRAKVLNDCFSWCVNTAVDKGSPTNMTGYMFQYIPSDRKLRPHFLVKYDNQNKQSRWVLPVEENTPHPLKTIPGVSLNTRDGWYYIRTEVFCHPSAITHDAGSCEELVGVKFIDNCGYEVLFEPSHRNRSVEIKIYDMNDLGKEIYHAVFNEPPLKCFTGGKIGFRNYAFESALYKDIVIYKL